jgi:23S rRNA pseudouridine2605 synthase/16S rRNA pseudouridine516 synthase
MLHKPAGAICAASDPEGIGTVFEVLERTLRPELKRYGWHAVGRLDRDTTGLLLFTNDEKLVAHVASPHTHLAKRYIARVSGKLTEKRLNALRRGIVLSDGPARPAKATIRGTDVVELTLTEGKYHQVKRMLGSVGLPVMTLHRVAIGELELDVAEGCARLLNTDEIIRALKFAPTQPSS